MRSTAKEVLKKIRPLEENIQQFLASAKGKAADKDYVGAVGDLMNLFDEYPDAFKKLRGDPKDFAASLKKMGSGTIKQEAKSSDFIDELKALFAALGKIK